MVAMPLALAARPVMVQVQRSLVPAARNDRKDLNFPTSWKAGAGIQVAETGNASKTLKERRDAVAPCKVVVETRLQAGPRSQAAPFNRAGLHNPDGLRPKWSHDQLADH